MTGTALADCTPDGTGNDDNITCDTTTDSDGNGDNTHDNDGVHGEAGADDITVQDGAAAFEVLGDSNSTGGTDDDTITVQENGLVYGGISGDSYDGDGNSGSDLLCCKHELRCGKP